MTAVSGDALRHTPSVPQVRSKLNISETLPSANSGDENESFAPNEISSVTRRRGACVREALGTNEKNDRT
jgi:hypothetical protein